MSEESEDLTSTFKQLNQVALLQLSTQNQSVVTLGKVNVAFGGFANLMLTMQNQTEAIVWSFKTLSEVIISVIGDMETIPEFDDKFFDILRDFRKGADNTLANFNTFLETDKGSQKGIKSDIPDFGTISDKLKQMGDVWKTNIIDKTNEWYKNTGKTGKKVMKFGKAFGKTMVKQVAPSMKKIAEMGPQFATMAIVTQPIMAFLQGFLGPFETFGELLGAWGEVLSIMFLPVMGEVTESFVGVIPLLKDFATAMQFLVTPLSRLLVPFQALLKLLEFLRIQDAADDINETTAIISNLFSSLGKGFNLISAIEFDSNLFATSFTLGITSSILSIDWISIGGTFTTNFLDSIRDALVDSLSFTGLADALIDGLTDSIAGTIIDKPIFDIRDLIGGLV